MLPTVTNGKTVSRWFESAFDDMWSFIKDGPDKLFAEMRNHRPAMNVYEKDKEFVVELQVPGMTADDIKVEVTPDHYLRISGSHGTETEDAKYHLREAHTETFCRAFRLPDNVDGEPEASLKGGVLRMAWPVSDQDVKTKVISVKTEE